MPNADSAGAPATAGLARSRRTPKLLALLLGAGLLASAAPARVSVVTLPGRDSVQLTIYNSADLTMVKETRTLTFRKGLNKLEFSWANTLIDPTSVEFRALSRADQVEVLDVSFPPRVTNTLEWRINAEAAGEVVCEIRYFTSGISWGADYVAEAETMERAMALAGHVRVMNNSGEDYENAQVRLVVGVIRLVEEIRHLAPKPQAGPASRLIVPTTVPAAPRPRVAGDALADLFEAEVRDITKEAVSEYFLYTMAGRDTIPTGWSKRLPSFRAPEVKITSYYKFEREQWGDQVIRFYKFKNDKDSQLGNEPLPDGALKAFRLVTADRLCAFVGATNVKYIPIGEEVELDLGNDREVMVQPKLMNWEKIDLRFNQHGDIDGWTTRESWEIEVQNSKEIPVVLDIRRHFAGDWELKSAIKSEKVDAAKVKFVLPLQPRQKRKLSYELVTRHGTNAQR